MGVSWECGRNCGGVLDSANTARMRACAGAFVEGEGGSEWSRIRFFLLAEMERRLFVAAFERKLLNRVSFLISNFLPNGKGGKKSISWPPANRKLLCH